MAELLLYGLIAGLFSLIGGVAVLLGAKVFVKIMTPLMAFAAGAFMGVSFLDLLPEAVEAMAEPEPAFMALLAGFFTFFALERFLMKYLRKDLSDGHAGHGDHTESLASLIVLGDTLHNLLDGIVIALAYVANPALGLTTAFAVAAHEVPQEIGDFAILLDRGWSKMKIFTVNVVSSLMAVVGVVVGYYAVSSFENKLPFLLAGVAGIFIYIAASEIIPEVHHRAGHKNLYRILFAFLLGLVLIGYLVGVTHAE